MTPRARRLITKQAPWKRKFKRAPKLVTKHHITCAGCLYGGYSSTGNLCKGCLDSYGNRVRYTVLVK